MKPLKSLAVFCGSSTGNDDAIIQQSKELGQTMAKRNMTLVYGGAQIGIMGTVAKAVLDNGGKAIGVVPYFLSTKEIVNSNLTELIETKTMHDRKVIMYDKSDGFLIIPGGFGTMDEFFEIATWGQLGLHTKPIGILNSNGYYDALISQCETMVAKGFLPEANFKAIQTDTTIEGLLNKMQNFTPLPAPKWLKKDRL
ncbi:TIGR00730 family Rossman fold protein [Winogradskyella maritima]|uniref:Cytokinin riboside 5'-monophosphate phosphoribohydrolase n=1 Tax=Winogradskyella maritima TaxID=1517766 RepID=A0ABV8AGS6_9FLAO|nr:TIGR00730 family Rossman fold protein [Winogradskyella maritima]